MFIQIMQGSCHDAYALRRQTEVWLEELAPGAQGWLGGTFGVTDDNRFVGVVRFESREAAEANSARPEQGAWWAVTEKVFDGAVTFRDCDDVTIFLDGGSDEAGFVQVIQGRVADPERFRRLMSQPMDILREARPEVIGGIIAIEPDGRFTQTVAFRSEDEAREGERKEMPAEVGRELEDKMGQMQEVTYLDLRDPWFASRQ